MAGIDYNLVNPTRQPGGEVASMAEMLNLIAERRQKNAQLAAARDLAERQYQTEKENKRLDNERADAQLQFSRDQDRGNQVHQRDLFEAAQRKEGLAQAAEGAKLALPAIDAGNMDAARTAVATHGGTMVPQSPSVLEAPPPLPPPEQVPAQPLTTAEPPLQSSVFPPRPEDIPHAGISVAPDTMNDNVNARATADWAGRNAAAAAAVQKQNEDAAAAAKHISQIQFPGTAPILYSDQAKQGADDARDKRTIGQLNAAGDTAVPYAKPAADTAIAAVPFQKEEGEAGRLFVSERGRLADAADRRLNAEMLATHKDDAAKRADRALNTNALRKYETLQKEFLVTQRYKENTKDFDEAGTALRLINSTAPGQKAAIDNFIKNARGGMATGQFLQYMSSNMAGLWSSLVDKMESYSSGGYGAESKQSLRTAIQDVLEASKQDKFEPMRQAYVEKFFTPEWGPFKTNAEKTYKSLFGRFGYKLDTEPGALGMTGTGQVYKAPAAPAGAAAPAAPGNADPNAEQARLLRQLLERSNANAEALQKLREHDMGL